MGEHSDNFIIKKVVSPWTGETIYYVPMVDKEDYESSIDAFRNISSAFWHRVNGPAYENKNGAYSWYRNNLLHRLDGPARKFFDIYGKVSYEWYINGLHLRKMNKWAQDAGMDVENLTENDKILISIKMQEKIG